MFARVDRYQELYQRNKEINNHLVLAFGGAAIGESITKDFDLDLTPEQETGLRALLQEREQNSEAMSKLRDNWSEAEEAELIRRREAD